MNLYLLPSLDGSQRWMKLPLSGGDISALRSFPDSNKILLCALYNGGLYRSQNRGQTWTQLLEGSLNDIAVLRGGMAFAAARAALFISHDYGSTWDTVINYSTWQVVALPDGIVAADTVTADRENMSHEKSPWILSKDTGRTWNSWAGTAVDLGWNMGMSERIKRGSLLFHSSGAVLRTEGNLIFKSNDTDWTQWTKMPVLGGLDAPFMFFSAFSDSDSTIYTYARYWDYHPGPVFMGGVYFTTNLGQDWWWIYENLSVTCMIELGPLLFFGDENGQVYKYDTAIRDSVRLGGRLGGEVTAIDASDWHNGKELIVATRGGIFRTTNGGSVWLKRDSGIYHPDISAVQVVPPNPYRANPRIVSVVRYSGVHVSDDAGSSWRHTSLGIGSVPGLLKKAPMDPSILYAAGSVIYRSSNAGETWNRCGGFPAAYYGWYSRAIDIEVSPTDPSEIFVNYFDHSRDHYVGFPFARGRFTSSWTWDTAGWINSLPNKSLRSQFDATADVDTGSLIWISQRPQYFQKTVPALAGVNLVTKQMVRSFTMPDSIGVDLWCIRGGVCLGYNTQKGIFWRTTDRGEVWSKIAINLKPYKRYDDWAIVQPIGEMMSPQDDPDRFFFLYPGTGVLVSEDSGESWRVMNDGLPDNLSVYQLEFVSYPETSVYAATSDGLFQMSFPAGVKNQDVVSSGMIDYMLLQNYPNPFNPTTRISFIIGHASFLTLKVYDILGREVATLVNGKKDAGKYEVVFPTEGCFASGGFPSGVYFYRLQGHSIGDGQNNVFSQIRKLILVK